MTTQSNIIFETAQSPTNIACIKYWGKRDVKYNLPINSSVSVTLDMEHLRTKTTIAASQSFQQDELYLNGIQEQVKDSKRVQAVFKALRERAQDRLDKDGNVVVRKEDWPQYKFRVVSENSFPTAAGLASSASGYACLVKCLAELLNVKETYPGELSTIARMGSGSACRSLYGGFVKWEMGQEETGADSKAVQIVGEEHWPELEVVICVVSDHKKDTSSTSGMGDSVRTSELLAHRASNIVPKRMDAIAEAFKAKDFAKFAEITMKDSNQFHCTCLDTYPPIFYMNDVSKNVIRLVHRLNDEAGEVKFGYTFDAGPNAVLFALKPNVQTLLDAILNEFPPSAEEESQNPTKQFVKGITNKSVSDIRATANPEAKNAGTLQYLYHTKIGPGAKILSAEESLVNPETGAPLNTK